MIEWGFSYWKFVLISENVFYNTQAAYQSFCSKKENYKMNESPDLLIHSYLKPNVSNAPRGICQVEPIISNHQHLLTATFKFPTHLIISLPEHFETSHFLRCGPFPVFLFALQANCTRMESRNSLESGSKGW